MTHLSGRAYLWTLPLVVALFFCWWTFSGVQSREPLARSEGANTSAVANPADLTPPESVTKRAPDQNEPTLTNDNGAETATAPTAETIGAVLSGTVTDLDDAAIAEAWVRVLDDSGEWQSARTDDEGHYTIENPPTGERLVTTYALLHRDAGSTAFIAEQGTTKHDFRLQSKQVIRVRVSTSAGLPAIQTLSDSDVRKFVFQMLPVATKEDPGPTFRGISGSRNNPFGIGSFWYHDQLSFEPEHDDEIGVLILQEDAPAWVSLVVSKQVMRKEMVFQEDSEVRFVIDERDFRAMHARIRGRIIDGVTGEPLVGFVSTSESPFHMGVTKREFTGEFLLEEVDLSARYLLIAAADRANITMRIEVVSGELLDVGDIELFRPVEIHGKTLNSAGEPIRAVLQWGRLVPRSNDVEWVRHARATSKEDGSFSIGGLDPGEWVVYSPGIPAKPPRPHDPTHASLPVRVDLRDGSVDSIKVVMHETANVTLVANDATEPWPRATAIDAAGLPAATKTLGRWGKETPMRLPPGTYELVIERDGAEVDRRTITAKAGVPNRLEFTFP